MECGNKNCYDARIALISLEEGEIGEFSTVMEDSDAVALYVCKDGTMEPAAPKSIAEDFSKKILTSSKQNAEAFHSLPKKSGKVTYSFTLTDNGSKDSGIMLGSSSNLNSSSKNYFASGSIVILFAGGKIYTRDSSAKKQVAAYNAEDSVEIRIEADTAASKYSLYVNNTLAAQNVAFRTTADTIDTLATVENGGGANYNITGFEIM